MRYICVALSLHVAAPPMTRQWVLRCMRLTRASSDKECDEAHLVRLTRNFDNQHGFVNGTVAVVCESLRGNEAFA